MWPKKGVMAAYLIEIGVWRKIYRAAKAKCKPGQRPFLWLDRATPHTAKITMADLGRVWGSDCWAPGGQDSRRQRRGRGCVPVLVAPPQGDGGALFP